MEDLRRLADTAGSARVVVVRWWWRMAELRVCRLAVESEKGSLSCMVS